MSTANDVEQELEDLNIYLKNLKRLQADDMSAVRITEELAQRGKSPSGFISDNIVTLNEIFEEEYHTKHAKLIADIQTKEEKLNSLRNEEKRELQAKRIALEEKQALAENSSLRFWTSQIKLNNTPFYLKKFPGLKGPGLRVLCKALATCKTFNNVSLSQADLDDEDAIAIANLIKANPNIHSVDLSLNNIGPQGFRELCRVLMESDNEKSNLSHFDISGNPIVTIDDKSGLIAFRDMMKSNKTLRTICLIKCSIEEDDGDIIIQGLEENKTLLGIELQGTGVSTQTKIHISHYISRNKELNSIEEEKKREEDAILAKKEAEALKEKQQQELEQKNAEWVTMKVEKWKENRRREEEERKKKEDEERRIEEERKRKEEEEAAAAAAAAKKKKKKKKK